MTNSELFVKQVPLFRALLPDDSRRIGELLRNQYLKKGDVLFRKGAEGTALYLIVEGKIKISVTSRLGDEVILAILSSGEFFGEMALLDGMPRSADAIAIEETHVLALNRKEFLYFVMSNETAVKAILGAVSLRLRKADDFLEDTCFLSVASRLAKKLVELAQTQGQREEDASAVKVNLTQSDLASMIGATRESINKELRVLREKGLVSTSLRTIIVHNVELLRKRIR